MTPAPTTPILDTRLAKFARLAQSVMNAGLAAEILELGEDSVRRLCRNGGIQTRMLTGANGHSYTTYMITPAALILYMVSSAGGDKTLILHALEQQLPQWLPFAQAAARGLRPSVETLEAGGLTVTRGKREQAKNVIPFDHPDLFEAQRMA